MSSPKGWRLLLIPVSILAVFGFVLGIFAHSIRLGFDAAGELVEGLVTKRFARSERKKS